MNTRIETLINGNAYTPEMAVKIEAIGAIAISIANRWMLGWPVRVTALLKAATYLECLESQVNQEKDILANEANMRHLSRREILQMYEIKESPPC
jgi:hypothetical protein